jgi:ferritin
MEIARLLDKATEDMLNRAVRSELYASHLYKHIANQCQRIGFFGAQKFFAGESADELEHYQKIADYMNDRGTTAKIPALEACVETVTGLVDAMELGYETELELMRDYEKFYRECKCVTTQQFLLQFLETQRKSVGEYGDWLSRMKIVSNDRCGLLMIDQELGGNG